MKKDGNLHHIPSRVVEKDGKYFVKFKGLSTGIFTVTAGQQEFIDMKGHWAEKIVNILGGKLVIGPISSLSG